LKFSFWYENTIGFFFIFERLGRMHENKTFCFYVRAKTWYFNTGFVSLQYKNTKPVLIKMQ